MYSIANHGTMIKDRVRMAAHEQALCAVVRPGCVVADIGAGSGVMSLLACRLGARRVYAIEPADIIEMARALAVANGCADRIVFMQDFSTRVTLPEPADVVVADLRGVLPWFQHNIPSLIDARTRLLAPGGAMMPQRDSVWLGVVQAPEQYLRFIAAWDDNGLDLDFSPARRQILHHWVKGVVAADCLVTAPQRIAVVDYTTITDPNLDAQAVCVVQRAGMAHGLSAWFDTELSAGVGFSNAPDRPTLLYGQGFFPWLEPVDLAVADRVTVRLRARLVGDDYVWNWDTTIEDGAGRSRAQFRQSTFFGEPLSPTVLRRGAADHVPILSPEAEVERTILDLIDGRRTIADIARHVAEQHPAHFPQPADALARVGELARKYAR